MEANYPMAGTELQVCLALSLLIMHTLAEYWAAAMLEGRRKGGRKRTDVFPQGLEWLLVLEISEEAGGRKRTE